MGIPTVAYPLSPTSAAPELETITATATAAKSTNSDDASPARNNSPQSTIDFPKSADSDNTLPTGHVSSQSSFAGRSRNPEVLAQVISEIMNSLQARALI
ncbi:hypothetical protein H9P43_003048 [Blastocladiella emersonii ATCC 22665]|nr:hypothetical protein H9P43_003048 [Blastocladiella emersonii ATCC 22665]